MQSAGLHLVERATSTNRRREKRSAAEIAPVVRTGIAGAFRFRPDSEEIATRYRISRLDVMDCVLFWVVVSLCRVMLKIGISNGLDSVDFGRAA